LKHMGTTPISVRRLNPLRPLYKPLKTSGVQHPNKLLSKVSPSPSTLRKLTPSLLSEGSSKSGAESF
jgi:hypothetical protein